MISVTVLSRRAAISLIAITIMGATGLTFPARADDSFPFGFGLTLDVARQPGSKRVPTLDIGDNGEATVELWCKGGRGQFSVAGDTVIFVAGALQDRSCPEARAQADDALMEALSEATNWKRQGDIVTFVGGKPLRFRLNTN